jgi:hypothetical protein
MPGRLKEVAQKTRYSPMMTTKVKDELEALQVCKSVRRGRSTMLDFMGPGRTLWERVNPHLNSPVKRTRWARWEHPAHPELLAGMSALSRLTMIADDRVPTYALALAVFQGLLSEGTIVGCPDAEPANARMEIWAYPPDLLSDDPTVAPLFLPRLRTPSAAQFASPTFERQFRRFSVFQRSMNPPAIIA